MKNTVLYGMTSQLCDKVLLGGCLCTIVSEYSSAITRSFTITSVIVVAISHISSAIYLNSNESSGGTSGCSGGIFLKIHNFNTSTKDANMFAIGK